MKYLLLFLTFLTFEGRSAPLEHRSQSRAFGVKTERESDGKASNDVIQHFRPIESIDSPPVPSSSNQKPLAGEIESKCFHEHPIDLLNATAPIDQLQSSPTGGIYYLSSVDGRTQLFHISKPAQKASVLTEAAQGVQLFEISPNGRQVLVVERRSKSEGSSASIRSTRSTTQLIIPTQPYETLSSARWDKKGKGLFYTAHDARSDSENLYYFDTVTGQAKLRSHLNGRNRIADLAPNGSALGILHFDSVAVSRFLILNNDDKISSPFAYSDAKFSADSESVFFVSDHEKGNSQLYVGALKKKTLKRLSQPPVGIDFFALSPTRHQLLVVLDRDGYSQTLAYEIDDHGVLKSLSPTPRLADRIHSAAFNTKERAMDFLVSDSDSETLPRIIEWNNRKIVPWTVPQTISGCFAKPRLVSYESQDKQTIKAFLYTPRPEKSTSTESLPYLILLHDGPLRQFRPAFHPEIEYLVKLGFGVLAPNYRGSSGYGRRFLLEGLEAPFAKSQSDIVQAALWLINTGVNGQKYVGLWGKGLGATLAIDTARAIPDRIGGLALVNPVQPPLFRDIATKFSHPLFPPVLLFFSEQDGRAPSQNFERLTRLFKAEAADLNSRRVNLFPDWDGFIPDDVSMARRIADFFDDLAKKKKKGLLDGRPF